MPRSLVENITRGRKAIALARVQGIDTSAWEKDLAELERGYLMGWAAEISEKDINLTSPISFIEAPLRPIKTGRISFYAAYYLTVITSARVQQQTGGWGLFTATWWKDREQEAFDALVNLRAALDKTGEVN